MMLFLPSLDILTCISANKQSFQNLTKGPLCFISWITSLNVQKLQIFAIFASYLASIVKSLNCKILFWSNTLRKYLYLWTSWSDQYRFTIECSPSCCYHHIAGPPVFLSSWQTDWLYFITIFNATIDLKYFIIIIKWFSLVITKSPQQTACLAKK